MKHLMLSFLFITVFSVQAMETNVDSQPSWLAEYRTMIIKKYFEKYFPNEVPSELYPKSSVSHSIEKLSNITGYFHQTPEEKEGQKTEGIIDWLSNKIKKEKIELIKQINFISRTGHM